MKSFLHYDITVVITFYILIFNMTSNIFHFIFKAFYKTCKNHRGQTHFNINFNATINLYLWPH